MGDDLHEFTDEFLPDIATEDIAFEDLFELSEIQRLQDEFARAANVASLITRVDGVPITKPSNFCRLCKDIIRNTDKGFTNCCASDRHIGRLTAGGPTVELCSSGGLWDAGAGISVGGRHFANWLIGQVRDEQQTEEQILAYAREIGANETEMLQAYREVPIMSREQFGNVARMLHTLAQQLSRSAYQNVLLERYLKRFRSLHENLRESEEKLRQITSSAQDAIVMMDECGNVSFWNESAETIFGYSQEEIIGKPLHTILAPATFKERYDKALAVFRNSGRGSNLNKVQELSALKKNGATFPIELSLSSVEVRGAWHAIGIIRDITARKESEAIEKKMAETLKHSQKMAAIGTLAGGIAHDFNNILSAILGFSDLLNLSIQPDTQSAVYLEHIIEAGTRAKNLVRQILAFSRQAEKSAQPVIVRVILQEALTLLRASLPADILIKQVLDSDSAVHGDPSQIHQIIMNLCTNAAHAMRDEGGVLEVRLADSRYDPSFLEQFPHLPYGKYIAFSVSDTGPGIPPEIRDQIFDPFFTTKEPGEGTGLGLSVVHGIVEGYHGAVQVHSELDKGTVFTVVLPIVDNSEPLTRQEMATPVRGTERILFVDDERAIVEIGEQVLGNLGYRVTALNNPVEALSLFAEQPDQFDLVISDLAMPHLPGDRLARELLAIRSTIPIIICTGYNMRLDENTAQALGIRAVLLKPVSNLELAQSVRTVLDQATRHL